MVRNLSNAQRSASCGENDKPTKNEPAPSSLAKEKLSELLSFHQNHFLPNHNLFGEWIAEALAYDEKSRLKVIVSNPRHPDQAAYFAALDEVYTRREDE